MLAFLSSLPLIAASLSGGADIKFRPPGRVTVVGGVHGNEYTGVWCVKSLERRLEATQRKYGSLTIDHLIANPEAHLANRRFLDIDLNRQFSQKALVEQEAKGIEGKRAREIDALLGPKFGADTGPATDCIIDLHSTTANMGLTLIFPEGDALMGRACAYALLKCTSGKTRILFEARSSREQEPFLQSVAPHGLTIEVGPVPQGVLRHDAVISTEEALDAALDYLHRHNIQPEIIDEKLKDIYKDGLVPCYLYKSKLAVSYH